MNALAVPCPRCRSGAQQHCRSRGLARLRDLVLYRGRGALHDERAAYYVWLSGRGKR